MRAPVAVLMFLATVVGLLVGVLQLAGAGEPSRWAAASAPDVARGGVAEHSPAAARAESSRPGGATRAELEGSARNGRACSTLLLQDDES